MKDLQIVVFYQASMETLEKLGIYEEYKVECQKVLKEIAETDEEIAKDIAKDLERETTLYMFSRARSAVERGEPYAFITSAFDWNTSEKGGDYWAEMALKFCESHPMVVTEDEDDSIKCNKCESTNVSVGSFGDRTGVTCKDCGESRLLVD